MSFPTPPPLPDAAPEPTTCFYHRDRETGRKCTRCGRPACPDCLHQASVGSHCWECIKAAAPPRKEQIRRAVRGEDLLVTKILIVLNVAMFIPTIATGGALGSTASDFHGDFALWGPAVAAGEWYRIVTSGFLHFGLIHLGMNMYILYQLGLTLEARGSGRLKYLAVYFASLFAGSFLALVLSPDASTAGASGAVFGLAGAATVGLSRRGIPFSATGWGPLLVINLIFTFAADGISIGGHIGGLIGGLIVGYLMFDPYLGYRRPWLGFVAAGIIILGSLAGSIITMNDRYGECEVFERRINDRIESGYRCERSPSVRTG
jgi:membrane associated rhomboid family serine protease